MKTKHTKGEWILNYPDCNTIDAPFRIGVDNIAGMVINPLCEVTKIDDLDEWEANAKLIAAAPDLLRACNLALTYINYNIEHGCGGGNEAKYATIIEASIKKATE